MIKESYSRYKYHSRAKANNADDAGKNINGVDTIRRRLTRKTWSDSSVNKMFITSITIGRLKINQHIFVTEKFINHSLSLNNRLFSRFIIHLPLLHCSTQRSEERRVGRVC